MSHRLLDKWLWFSLSFPCLGRPKSSVGFCPFQSLSKLSPTKAFSMIARPTATIIELLSSKYSSMIDPHLVLTPMSLWHSTVRPLFVSRFKCANWLYLDFSATNENKQKYRREKKSIIFAQRSALTFDDHFVVLSAIWNVASYITLCCTMLERLIHQKRNDGKNSIGRKSKRQASV